MELYNGDCLEVMKDIKDGSVDLLFCDLPYGQTSCKWDCLIDLDLFWEQINRICKEDCPMFFTCSTKFGVSLINSNPKNFRYDLVWVKSSPCGFLNAKKMPMKKHEMVYVFYKKIPKVYGECITEHHTHKFIKETENKRKEGGKGCYTNGSKTEVCNKYDPPLPTSVIRDGTLKTTLYSSKNKNEPRELWRNNGGQYEPPLPTSVIRNDDYDKREIKHRNTIKQEENYGKEYLKNKQNFRAYNPKLGAKGEESHLYEPPLPTSVIRNDCYEKNKTDDKLRNGYRDKKYEPPLPNSILEIASQKGKHATQKPVDLIKWCLKYYSKEGDVVLDPTMGSGSTGVACKEMNRQFIGIEMDEDIFKVAEERCK